MPSIDLYASRDRTERVTLDLGFSDPLVVTYYPNRITTERTSLNGTSSAEERAAHDASAFCDIFAAWDLTGPLINHAGETVVAESDVIPLEPDMIRLIPIGFRLQIMTALGASIAPKVTALPPSPTRS